MKMVHLSIVLLFSDGGRNKEKEEKEEKEGVAVIMDRSDRFADALH